jgi:hypothetical protein
MIITSFNVQFNFTHILFYILCIDMFLFIKIGLKAIPRKNWALGGIIFFKIPTANKKSGNQHLL